MKYTPLLLLLLFSCHKQPQLPPATHSGANILACKVNGGIFSAQGVKSIYSDEYVAYSLFTDSVVFIEAETSNPRLEIVIYCMYPGLNIPVQLYFSPYPGSNGAEFYDFSNGTLPTGGNTFQTDSTHVGSITFTYYDGKILSGVFSFDAANSAGVIKHITEGRFDISKN